MTTPTSVLGMSDIQTEFGGSNPIALSEYYGVNANVAVSGTITMASFLGISAWTGDPTQPSVTISYWHGTFNWSAGLYYTPFITRTGHLTGRLSTAVTFMSLDASGAKVWANTYSTAVAGYNPFVYTSFLNPNRQYYLAWNSTDRAIIIKQSNTGVGLLASNLNWSGTGNNNSYIYTIAPTSGTQNSNTSIFLTAVSNTVQSNTVFSTLKLNATDMTTIEWVKSVTVGRDGADATSNIRPLYIWTNHNESSVVIAGTVTTTNTGVVVLRASDGTIEQNWKVINTHTPINKTLSANNIAFTNVVCCWIKSNTGGNVSSIGVSNTSWRMAYAATPDYDGATYLHATSQQGNTSTVHAMIGKYNSAGTRQWQVRISSLTAANAVQVLHMNASNTGVILVVNEYTLAHDGKKWAVTSTGEIRYLHISAASGNTGTMGRFSLASNTTAVFGGMSNTGTYTYTYSPRSTTELTFQSKAVPTATANGTTFTKTAL